ncbi:uncharacterized protein [Physcomitrium patens]|uniref:uncharacterized protein n=1 Tax=Physcomitrium patens TaxID=3218 RepID=UPI003CCDF17B
MRIIGRLQAHSAMHDRNMGDVYRAVSITTIQFVTPIVIDLSSPTCKQRYCEREWAKDTSSKRWFSGGTVTCSGAASVQSNPMTPMRFHLLTQSSRISSTLFRELSRMINGKGCTADSRSCWRY